MPLRLDLLRHGDALPAGGDGDAARRLSSAGREAVAWIASEYLRRDWRPSAIYSSPLIRAIESASILASALGPSLIRDTLDELTPDGEPEDVAAALAARSPGEHVVLVGHQPLIGRLADFWTVRRDRGVPTAGLLCLEFIEPLEPAAATLLCELRPPARGEPPESRPS